MGKVAAQLGHMPRVHIYRQEVGTPHTQRAQPT
jgi:hypothetical protein